MVKYFFDKPKSSPVRLTKSKLYSIRRFTKGKMDIDGCFYLDVTKPPFVIGGLLHPDENKGEFYRLDPDKRMEYSDANRGLAECTAGGSVRFATDATEISIRVKLRAASVGMHHFADRGVYGLDVYVGTGTKRVYAGKPMQMFTGDPNYHQEALWLEEGVKEIQINLPLYGGIEKLEVGFFSKSKVGAPTPRTNGAIAFYGSSITQGGCVSRPANSYCNIICRALDADCVNYGFSGSAMGELSVAEHIASRNLACFVMDYDYNSPTAETLAQTHEPFFKRIREIQPELPIVFVTHPYYSAAPDENDLARFAVVRKTYENAIAAGDKNVYFVSSEEFFSHEMSDLYSVDFLHPNDLGQYFMAKAIYPAVKKAIKK